MEWKKRNAEKFETDAYYVHEYCPKRTVSV